MRKRRVIILAVAVVAVLSLMWWAVASKPPDPVYAGHPVSYWLNPLKLPSPGYPSPDSNAVPYLVEALKRRDGAIRTAWIKVWGHFPGWLQERIAYPMPAVQIRERCCWQLGALGTVARPAIPELIRLLREDDADAVRGDAAQALADIANGEDKDAVSAMGASATTDTDALVRLSADEALRRINRKAAAKAGVTNAATPARPQPL